MLTIYLARHGQDEDNAKGILNGRRNTPLTEKGIEQAGLVAKEIKGAGIRFDDIYTSPLKRAYTTAEIIADNVNGPRPEILDDLIERDFGIMTGISNTRIEEMCSPEIIKTETVTYFLSPDGAETFPDLIDRAKKVLALLTGKHQEGNVLLVCHGDFGKMIYCAYYNLDWKNVLRMFHFGNSEVLTLSPNSKADEVYLFRSAQYNL